MSRKRSVQKGAVSTKRGERSSLRAQQKIWGEREFAPSKSLFKFFSSLFLAEWTGLEPATPGVTGRYSNQLNYHSISALGLPQASRAKIINGLDNRAVGGC